MSGSGCRVPGVGCRVSGFGFRVPGVRFWVSGSGYRVSGFGLRVSGSGCRVLGVGFQVSDSGWRVSGFGFRVSGSGCLVAGFGFWVEGCLTLYQGSRAPASLWRKRQHKKADAASHRESTGKREQILLVETLDLYHRSQDIGDLQYESTGVENVDLLPLKAGGLG